MNETKNNYKRHDEDYLTDFESSLSSTSNSSKRTRESEEKLRERQKQYDKNRANPWGIGV